MLKTKAELKGVFQDGDSPTGADFTNLIDSSPSNIETITYANLLAAATGGTLIPNQLYRFQYTHNHMICNTTEYHTGTPEFLIVRAVTSTRLELRAVSESYPMDIIDYQIQNNTIHQTTTGNIIYRKDVVRNIEVWTDWRNTVARRWDDGNGIFCLTSDNALTYVDYPMFNPDQYPDLEQRPTGEYRYQHISLGRPNLDGGIEVWGSPPPHLVSVTDAYNIVFRNEGYKVTLGNGTEGFHFNGFTSDVHISTCSSAIFKSDCENYTSGPNCGGNVFNIGISGFTLLAGSQNNTFNASVGNAIYQGNDGVINSPIDGTITLGGASYP